LLQTASNKNNTVVQRKGADSFGLPNSKLAAQASSNT